MGAALERGALRWVCDDDCAAEFERVLGYPKLTLTPARTAELVAAFRAMTTRVGDGPDPVALPRCRDADDQKFLRLAARENARWLITRDKALLQLARRLRTVLPATRLCAPQDAAADLPGG